MPATEPPSRELEGKEILIRTVNRWTPKEDAELARMAAAGADTRQIAQTLHRSIFAVLKRAKKLGIKLASGMKLMTSILPNMIHRQIMQRLLSGDWKTLTQLGDGRRRSFGQYGQTRVDRATLGRTTSRDKDHVGWHRCDESTNSEPVGKSVIAASPVAIGFAPCRLAKLPVARILNRTRRNIVRRHRRLRIGPA